jgi:cyclic pyranopterin phosphate synthase
MAIDSLGRPLRDLRISVTDRCNFRCTYCMPKEIFGPDWKGYLPRADLLTFEEIAQVARLFVREGVEKIRLTGGEPLLRRDIERLVAMLARIKGVQDLAVTTNGSLLTREKARTLRDAGLTRATVSLDSLDDAIFRRMNDVDFPVRSVLDAIDAATEAGLTPVKIDMVVQRGVNDHCVVDMIRHFRGSGHIVRFIEYMDVGNTNGWRMEDVVPGREIIGMIGQQWPIAPLQVNYFGEVAERWQLADGSAEFGVISSVTQPFCGTCTRARLSADGKLYLCLFAGEGHDLRSLIRGGADDDTIASVIAGHWRTRTDRYSEVRFENEATLRKVEMSHIGG